MKRIFNTTKALLAVLCTGWGLLVTGCINEDLEGCYTLTLKVVNINGEDITGSGDVAEAGLYVFDGNGKYLETITLRGRQITEREPVLLKNYPATATLKIVGWGNLGEDGHTVTTGATIDAFGLKLKSVNTLANAPADLFFGDKDVPLKAGLLTKNEEVVIAPKVSSVEMRTENLPKEFDRERRTVESCQYYIDKTLDAYNYSGVQVGDSVYYKPDGAWATDEWVTPEAYNMFSGTKMTAALEVGAARYSAYEGTLEGSSTLTPITIPEGRSMLVVFVFDDAGVFMGVKLKVRPWGFVDDDIEW